MIRDITIGQYYPAQSQVHRLDPRVKIVCTLAFLVSLFLQNSILGYVVAFAFLAIVIRLSKVPVKFIVRGLKPIVILLLFTVLMNLFLTRSGNILFHYGILTITEGGLRTCVFIDLSGDGIFHHDIYDHPEQPDRRNRKVASSAEPDPCSGA